MRLATPSSVSRSIAAGRRYYSATASGIEQPVVLFVPDERYEARQNSLLGPSKNFPLPGEVAAQPPAIAVATPAAPRPLNVPSCNIGMLLNSGRVDASREYIEKAAEEARIARAETMRPQSALAVEMQAQACPRLLMKDVKALWPSERFPAERKVNVLNISQKTENDMSAWSQTMEAERERLTAEFIDSAQEICALLQRCGYWADFVDPASGRPYLSGYTQATLFETHDAYRHMGFQIEDLGCCKVLKHLEWGVKAFVGTIFTDAPLDAEITQVIRRKINNEAC